MLNSFISSFMFPHLNSLTQLEQLKAQQGVESPNCGDSKAVDIVQMLFKAEHEYNKVSVISIQSDPSRIRRQCSNLFIIGYAWNWNEVIVMFFMLQAYIFPIQCISE